MPYGLTTYTIVADAVHVTLSEAEVMLLTVMAQYWIEELPSDAPLALELSDQLRELACRIGAEPTRYL